MINRKLWSPGKTKKGWVLWVQYSTGDFGDKHFYVHESEAIDAARSQVSGMVSSELDFMAEGEPGEPDPDRDRLLGILRLLDKSSWDGVSAWERWARDYNANAYLHVEQGFVHGA